jgi:hypothetical protein
MTSAIIKTCLIHSGFCSTPMAEPSGKNEMEPTLGEMFSCVLKQVFCLH